MVKKSAVLIKKLYGRMKSLMKYNFDKIINRYNTNSLKYDCTAKFGVPNDIQPMWVADMDFETAPCVIERLKQIAEFGVFGYSVADKGYFDALYNWYHSRFGFDIKSEWVVHTPGVVCALNTAVRAFTNEGDSVMIQRPVYYPFTNAINNNNRKLINNPLKYENGCYSMDFIDMERKIISEKVKLFILCSPHNPVGRVWTKEELIKLGEICLRHNVTIVADEIHSDFVFEGKHTIFATINERFLNNCIICTSPSKTFNIAGLQVSNIIIANENLRKKFIDEKTHSGYGELNIFGIGACEAAYRGGSEWLSELLKYLENNYLTVKNFISEKMPEIKVANLEGTYLVWLDCQNLGYTHKELNEKLLYSAKLWFDEGTIFGAEGENFMRINIACPRAELICALEKMYKTLYK